MLAAAKIQQAVYEAWLASLPEEKRLGDMHMVTHKDVEPYDALWMLTIQHRDNPDLYYAIPCTDSFCILGTNDLEDENSRGETIYLRCKHGMWIHTEDLGTRLDVASATALLSGRWYLNRLAHCDFEAIKEMGGSDEDDPDYQEFSQELAKHVHDLENAVQGLGE